MSKYNLIDIFEQYQIGSGWTNDFDYNGMLNAGLNVSVDTNIETLKKIFEDFTDVNYHREAEHLHYAIEAIEGGDIFEAEGKLNDFFAEIRKTMETFDMDTSDDLGAFMASKMEENTEAVDLAIEASQEKAGIKEDKYDDIVNADDDIPAGKKKAAALAYRKVDKGDSYENATSHIKSNKNKNKNKMNEMKRPIVTDFTDTIYRADAYKYTQEQEKYIDYLEAQAESHIKSNKNKNKINEVRIDKEVANKIEGMLSRPLKAQFLDAFDDVWEDLTEDDMFYPEDVINHLNNEMHKRLSLYRTSDPKPEEIPMFMGTRDALDDISIREEDKEKDKGVPEKPSIIRALKVDGNGTKMEIDSYMASVKRSGDEFDDVDDYVEDFKNYIADKSLQENFILQEHFKRFI